MQESSAGHTLLIQWMCTRDTLPKSQLVVTPRKHTHTVENATALLSVVTHSLEAAGSNSAVLEKHYLRLVQAASQLRQRPSWVPVAQKASPRNSSHA